MWQTASTATASAAIDWRCSYFLGALGWRKYRIQPGQMVTFWEWWELNRMTRSTWQSRVFQDSDGIYRCNTGPLYTNNRFWWGRRTTSRPYSTSIKSKCCWIEAFIPKGVAENCNIIHIILKFSPNPTWDQTCSLFLSFTFNSLQFTV